MFTSTVDYKRAKKISALLCGVVLLDVFGPREARSERIEAAERRVDGARGLRRLGDAQPVLQASSGLICDISGTNNCQLFDDALDLRASDLTVPGGARAADDFVPSGGTINSVCVWGVYEKGTEFGVRVECGGEVTDNFGVFVYNADPVTGLPSTLKGSSMVAGANVSKGVVAPTRYEDVYRAQVWAYKLTLDTPIAGLTPGAAYWLEVNNITDDPIIQSPNCIWFWMQVDLLYNDYSASGSAPWYGVYAARTGDLAWCLDMDVTPPPTPQRACCGCQGTCSDTTKGECDNAGNGWQAGHVCQSYTCPGVPDNDNCQDVLAGPSVGVGLYSFDNHCASTSGPNPIPNELGSASMARDVWYRFVSDCPPGSDAVFSTCPTGSAYGGGFDSFIAVYHNRNNPTVCECPTTTTQTSLLWPAGLGNDEGCFGLILGGGGIVSGNPDDPTDNVNSGDCFMVRVGGFAGQGTDQGIGAVVMECSGVCRGRPCGDVVTKGIDDLCAGGANAGSACAVNSDCPGGFCRNKNRFVTAEIPATATATGLKLTIVNLDPNSAATPANYNGTDRWVAAPTLGINDGVSPPFNAAKIQCAFQSTNWSAVGRLHIYGDVVVPLSTYDLSSCNPQSSCSATLRLGTAKFGDVVAPVSTVNFQDINSIVAKFQGTPAGPSKTRTKLVNSTLNPASPINFQEVSACVSAFQGKAFKTVVPTPPIVCP